MNHKSTKVLLFECVQATPIATPEPPKEAVTPEPSEKSEGLVIGEVRDEEPTSELDSKAEEPHEEQSGTDNKENFAEDSNKSPPIADKEKIRELVTTEISLEKQLESVQKQLLALKQLPSEIENHLRVVSEQLHKIMEMSLQNVSIISSRRESAGRSEQLSLGL